MISLRKYSHIIVSILVLLFLWLTWFGAMRLVTEKGGAEKRAKTFRIMSVIYPFSVSIKKSSSKAFFKANISSAKASFYKKRAGYKLAKEGKFLALYLKEKPLKNPEVSKNNIIYELPQYKAKFEIRKQEIKASYIFKEKPKTNILMFDLKTNLPLIKRAEGDLALGSFTNPLFLITKPYLEDKKGLKGKVKMTFEENKLFLEMDNDFLRKAAYPLVLDPSTVVKTGTINTSTAYANGRKLARKSNGERWTVYYRSDGTTDQIYASYSTDLGQNWTEEQVTSATGTNHQRYPSIAIDSADNVHVVWNGAGWGTQTAYNNIQYRKRTTSWQTQEGVTDKNANQYAPSITIDSSDNVHVVWYGSGWGTQTAYNNIQYRKRTTSWQTQEGVTDKNASQQYPSIAIDSSDNVHVVWNGLGWGTQTAYFNIQYRKRTTSWQTQEGLTDRAYWQYYPNLIWARWPVVNGNKTNVPTTGYAFVWSGNSSGSYQVEYFYSSDLSFPVPIFGPVLGFLFVVGFAYFLNRRHLLFRK